MPALDDNCQIPQPAYPEVDIALLQSGEPFEGPTGPSYSDPNFGIPNDQAQPEVDIALLPGVPNQMPPLAYKHSQSASSAIWTITHDLNFYPNVTVFDSSGSSWEQGNTVEGDVVHISKKVLEIHFSMPINGTAILS
jgi:hypothetical protein